MTPTRKPIELAISASPRRATIATRDDNGHVEASKLDATLGTGSNLIATIAATLTQSNRGPRDISRILMDRGPGSYTGLRVALTFARTMHAWTGAPVLGATSLELAVACAKDSPVGSALVAMDARRGRLHGATIDTSPEQISLRGEPVAQPASAWQGALREVDWVLATHEVAGLLQGNEPRANHRPWPQLHAAGLFDSRIVCDPLRTTADFEPLYLMGSYAED